VHVSRSTRILHSSIFLKCTVSTHAWHEICEASEAASMSHDIPLKGRICCRSPHFIPNVRHRLDTASSQVCATAGGCTYCMEQSPSWEANWFTASQEILCILWNPNVHYHIHKFLPPVPLLSHLDPVLTSTSNFLKNHLPSPPIYSWSPKWSLFRQVSSPKHTSRYSNSK
jgi:hypothetical protein